ncbi:hypothetical protein NEMBOFW57_010847 [Staphylotrichum longicolle]|uniref:F-box domain-containing protein n=1 Tax=Staphylotrichum longicolle TaxID=669026 RepID=A0AAD4ENG1_9PEZI|nr:hypothetical protein NEMBOFW57_010847 [Staphylotrichum longicolle]
MRLPALLDKWQWKKRKMVTSAIVGGGNSARVGEMQGGLEKAQQLVNSQQHHKMRLLQPPTEILLLIFNHLGPKFFAQDLRCLAVSKQWHDLAWPVLVRDLSLRGPSLARLSHNPTLLARSQRHIVTFTLHLEGPPGRAAVLSYARWSAELTTALTALFQALSQAPALRALTLTAHALGNAGHILPARALANLLSSVQHRQGHYLTSLHLDTHACPIGQEYDAGVHLCASINALLLPSLRVLRCRMERVCPVLLGGEDALPMLEEVVVNLSLAPVENMYFSGCHAGGCGGLYGDDGAGLAQEMERAASVLVGRMGAERRRVRILSHRLPSLELVVFDAVEGRREVMVEVLE